MNARLFIMAALLLALAAFPARAMDLKEALTSTYQNNPRLLASQKAAAAVTEDIAQANANFRPSMTLNAEAQRTRIEVDNFSSAILGTPKQTQLLVEQPLFRGGSSVASFKRAKAAIFAAYAGLSEIEQEVLLLAVNAYSNLVRDKTTLDLRRHNVKMLERQLEETQVRFDVGEVSKTDLAQAQSRLSLAEAEMIEAKGILDSSKAVFEQVVGQKPGRIFEPRPPDLESLTLEKVQEMALERSYRIRQAELLEEAALHQVDENVGRMLPQVSLEGSAARSEDNFGFGVAGVNYEVYSLLARVSVPFYQGGAESSRIRQARKTANQRRFEIEDVRSRTREEAISAWQNYTTARARIASLTEQVKASEVALEGVRLEEQQGLRTVLDVLDAQQEALESKTNLIAARRDFVVRGYEVLALTGQLTAREQDLPVEFFDTQALFDRTRTQWWGFQ